MEAPSLRSQERTPPSVDVPTPGQVSSQGRISPGGERLVQKETLDSSRRQKPAAGLAVVEAASPDSTSQGPRPALLATACRTLSRECRAVRWAGSPPPSVAVVGYRGWSLAAVGTAQTVFTKGIRFVKWEIHPKVILARPRFSGTFYSHE